MHKSVVSKSAKKIVNKKPTNSSLKRKGSNLEEEEPKTNHSHRTMFPEKMLSKIDVDDYLKDNQGFATFFFCRFLSGIFRVSTDKTHIFLLIPAIKKFFNQGGVLAKFLIVILGGISLRKPKKILIF